MTTTETCGEHFQVGQSLQAWWPHSICGRAKGHSGTHGLLPDTEKELVRIPDASPKNDYVSSTYEQGTVGYISGLHKAAILVCKNCLHELPELSADRITYPEPTWLHNAPRSNTLKFRCPATPIYQAIREAETEQ